MIKKTFSILVIDDEPINVMVLQVMLQQQGYRVLTASNGVHGREIAQLEVPDLILLDVMMPGEDGFTTCGKLKSEAVTADIPVVFISAMDDVESKVKGLTVGGWDYIPKPFQRAEVMARVKNYLRLRYTFLRVIEEQSRRLQQIQEAQLAILVKPEDVPEAGFAVHFLPVLEAGGDFYDVFEISAGFYGYFVADISGHDLGAFFATSALKALIRQNSSQLYSPDETVRMVNSILISIFSSGQHLTAAYGCLDRAGGSLYLVNAAHLPVLLLPVVGPPQWLEADGDVLGVFANGYFACQQVKTAPGDRIFFYSDGLLESFELSPRTREQGMQELLAAAILTRNLPRQQATAEMVRQMFASGRKPEDDVLLLLVDV